MKLGLLIAFSASLLPMSACEGSPNVACPLVSAPSGVIFKLDDLGPLVDSAELRACADDRCVTSADASAAIDRRRVFAGAEDGHGPRTVTARLTLTDPATHVVIVDAATRVTLHRVDPVQCSDPDRIAYQATVRATAAGELVPR